LERDKNGQIARRKEPEVVGKTKERAQSTKESARSYRKDKKSVIFNTCSYHLIILYSNAFDFHMGIAKNIADAADKIAAFFVDLLLQAYTSLCET